MAGSANFGKTDLKCCRIFDFGIESLVQRATAETNPFLLGIQLIL